MQVFKNGSAVLSLEDKTALTQKLTQKFKFNLYVINDEIDVFTSPLKR